MPTRWGMTVPLTNVPPSDHAAVFSTLADAGVHRRLVGGGGLARMRSPRWHWPPRGNPGSGSAPAIAPVFTRGPGLLAMSAAALTETAPDRFHLGIGASSPVVVGNWNGVEFTEPYERSRDMLRFLRAALAGEMVSHEYGTFAVRRFRLERPPATPPRLLFAALRPGMLRLACGVPILGRTWDLAFHLPPDGPALLT